MAPQLTFAPAQFPMFGLAGAVQGLRRWLHYVNGGNGQLNEIVLAHGAAVLPSPQIEWVAVTSSARTIIQGDDDGWTALDAALALTRFTQPALSQRKRDRYESAAARFAADRTNDRMLWNETQWFVDDQMTPAFTMEFAGAWGGFASRRGVNLTVVSTRPIIELSLTLVENSRDYSFDAAKPLEFPDSFVRSKALTWGEAAMFDHPWPTHPDHDLLIGF